MDNITQPLPLVIRVSPWQPSLKRYGVAAEYFQHYLAEDIPPHSVDVVLLQVILRGRGRLLLGDEVFDETGGSVSITHYGQVRRLIPDAKGMDLYNVYLDLQNHPLPVLPKSLEPTLTAILPLHPQLQHQLNRSVRIRVDDVALMQPSLARIEQEMNSTRPGAAELVRHSFQMFLIDLCRAAQRNGFTPLVEGERKATPWIEKIRQQLDSEFAEPQNLHRLAASARASVSHLCYAFKAYTGKTVFTYLTERRIHAAMWQLRSSDKKIMSIAMECGFSDLNYFNRVFKRIVGCTPSAYRKDLR